MPRSGKLHPTRRRLRPPECSSHKEVRWHVRNWFVATPNPPSTRAASGPSPLWAPTESKTTAQNVDREASSDCSTALAKRAASNRPAAAEQKRLCSQSMPLPLPAQRKDVTAASDVFSRTQQSHSPAPTPP